MIAVEGISVEFGKLRALDHVSAEFASGTVHLLAGPNGAGKSTLIRVLLGLVRLGEGKLSVDGEPRRVDNAYKRKLGYLPEAVAFSENLTGRQVLRFFAAARGVKKARLEAVLERVGLAKDAGRAVRGYSRGMRQRLGLGLAILHEPSFLILDEPTGGLDQEGLQLLWSVLDEWRDDGRAVLLASHDLALMESRVDQVCLLKDGSVLADDSPAELRKRARVPVGVNFEVGPNGAATELRRRVADWGRDLSVTETEGHVRVEVAPEDLLGLLDVRQQTGDAVRGIRVEEPGLDSVYDRLIEEAST